MINIGYKGNNEHRSLKNVALIFIISFLVIFPGIFYKIYTNSPVIATVRHAGLCFLFLLIPLVLFYRNIKVYLYLLAGFALLAPMVCFSIYFFGLHDMSIITALILQTNLHEVTELGRGLAVPFLLVALLYITLYFFCINKTSLKRIPFIIALVISLFSVGVVGRKIHLKSEWSGQPYRMVLDRYYPASVVSSIVNSFNNPFEPEKINDFSFHAYRVGSLNQRQIDVFIIGESSEYGHWEINGCSRPTSPEIIHLRNLVAFSDAASGAHFTAFSVPQMITRATPDDMKIQYQEKSILSAFKDAGFKTAWLSNQYPDHWISTIVPHAMTADICLFPDSKRLNQSDPYDGRFLPVLDSMIHHTPGNLFIVLHTMGSHWDYSKRYPRSFDYFKPSGKDVSIVQLTKSERQAIINSYDNSIRYSDFIIDSTIQMVKKYNAVSYVVYLADHGEDVYDSDSTRWYSHDKASRFTLHVPLFIWTSDQYNKAYPLKREALVAGRNRKIGEDNIFYTLLNMAGITFPGFDSTKSISSGSFKDSPQKYIEPNGSRAQLYSKLPK